MECAAVREFTGVHNMIRGLIDLSDSAMVVARPDNVAQMRTLAALGLFGVVGTRFHHQVEDKYYWPAIIANGADPTALDPLVREHGDIDPLLDEMEQAANQLQANPRDTGSFEDLRTRFAEFKLHILGHLDNEEPLFFPLLTDHMPDPEAERLAADVAKVAPRQGISWLMGGVEYAMTKDEATQFLGSFPKPIVWLRPLFLRTYRKNCSILGVDPATPART